MKDRRLGAAAAQPTEGCTKAFMKFPRFIFVSRLMGLQQRSPFESIHLYCVAPLKCTQLLISVPLHFICE